jgi:NAD(P)-dependent dehydrogenase (short-subunit alcohol dehydrogenase family)
MDVTKEAETSTAVQSAASKFGRIDISIHGAGITGLPAATHESSLENWQPAIDINLTGVMLCDGGMVRQMLTQD